jgi:hypothetical protein
MNVTKDLLDHLEANESNYDPEGIKVSDNILLGLVRLARIGLEFEESLRSLHSDNDLLLRVHPNGRVQPAQIPLSVGDQEALDMMRGSMKNKT